ncbi:MAG: HAMP domain-containing protein [Geobacter sp.]|nr:HAMP domain-containing protein [Geobacter sp.]
MRASSLSKSFITRVLLVLVVVQLVMMAFTYSFELADLKRSLKMKVDAIGRLVGYASLRALDENDVNEVGLLIDESLKDGDLVFFKLEDPGKYVVIDRTKPGKSDLTAVFPVVKGADTVGTLTIGYSLKGVREAMVMRMLAKGSELALLLIAISFTVIVLFRSRVASRVKEMEISLEQATHGDLTVTVADDRNDEISRIAEGINYLIGQLRSSFARIAELSAETSRTTGALVASFSASVASMEKQHESTTEISAAIDKATQSHGLITRNTQQLQQFSEQNTLALQQSVAVSKEIAGRIEQLNSGMDAAHKTVDAINRAAGQAASMAERATQEALKGASSAGNVRNSISMITEVISQSAAQTENTTRVISEKGMGAVNETRSSMESIHALTESLTESMLTLDSGSQDIAKIVAVIEDIAKRTKLLSLNTSIIAAQAGEYGKSFLVDANEMKQLSDLTANHTMEIAGIIGSIQLGISDAVEKTRDASRRVEKGSLVVANAGEALEEILDASRNSASMVRRVMDAATMQQSGLEEVLASLDHLEKLNTDVSRAMVAEQGNIGLFAGTIEQLCESMEVVSSSTEQQVVTMQHVMGNLRGANEQINQISSEIEANQHENLVIADSVQTVIDVTAETINTLNGASKQLTEAFTGIDQLRQEMEQFKT